MCQKNWYYDILPKYYMKLIYRQIDFGRPSEKYFANITPSIYRLLKNKTENIHEMINVETQY